MRRPIHLLVVATLIAMMSPLFAGMAAADHIHFRVLGDGRCVLLAAQGGEPSVQLPHQDHHPENRRHPLHTNVHLGPAGSHDRVGVAYLGDGQLHPDATRVCGGARFVNAHLAP